MGARVVRGGREGSHWPWGDELEPGGVHRMNVFQGTFPNQDTGDDGVIGVAPVKYFQPNDFGLYEVTGNVWECARTGSTLARIAGVPSPNRKARRPVTPGFSGAARISATRATAGVTGWTPATRPHRIRVQVTTEFELFGATRTDRCSGVAAGTADRRWS